MMSLPDFMYKQVAFCFAGGEGYRLKFQADNILLKDREDKVVFQHSCHRLFALFIVGETSLTSGAIAKAVSFSFPIVLMKQNFKTYAVFNCVAEGNTLLRKKQYLAGERNLLIARSLIEQKIKNQADLLQSLRYMAQEDKAARDYLLSQCPQKAQSGSELMGIEGNASRVFFSAYFRPLGWKRREPRCKRDVYNLLLDIGYTLLFNFIEGLLSLYGFDLYCGVHHTFFYQRKSLVCDIVEPFRCIIDCRLRKAYNLGQINQDDFSLQNAAYQLQYKAQKKYVSLFMNDILERKEDIFKFCQSYYRWFVQEKPIADFPVFKMKLKGE